MRIILASSSPRRKELMESLDLPFEIKTSDVDETINRENNIYDESMDVAKRKAEAVFQKVLGDVIVIGSDTIVLWNNEIFGKPKDYEDAKMMLRKLSGDVHEVISSLCLLVRKDGKEYVELTYDKCDVYVDNLTDFEIDAWIKKNDVYGKAGAYAIQEGFGKHIKKIEGDYFTIVGFPLHKAYELLKKYQ